IQHALGAKELVDNGKSWVAAAVVLGYLYLRYRFSPHTEILMQGVRRHYDAAISERVMPLVTAITFEDEVPPKHFGPEYSVEQQRFRNLLTESLRIGVTAHVDSWKGH